MNVHGVGDLRRPGRERVGEADRVAGPLEQVIPSRPSRASTSRAAYNDEKSDPTTATPRAPPSSRAASLTAIPPSNTSSSPGR